MKKYWVIMPFLLSTLAIGADKPDSSIVDSFSYDTKTAREYWEPMYDVAPVKVARGKSTSALVLPCKFKDTELQRASWDRQVKLDMSTCQGLQMQFYTRDISPVSRITIYFRSGNGWYVATVNPRQMKWESLRILKEQTQIQGRPAGWGHIDMIRISAWRNRSADTDLYISDMRLLDQKCPLIVIRSQADPAGQYASNVVRSLYGCGLGCSLMEEADLTFDRLKDKKLVILPYNPDLSNKTVRIITDYLNFGGRIITFYTIPPELAKIIGVKYGGYVRPEKTDTFSTIRPRPGVLSGFPGIVHQGSWNIQNIDAIEGRSLVAADWYDATGKDSGLPAIVATVNCICVTHVLLSDHWPGKQRMMLAMVCKLLPELWKPAADQQLVALTDLEKRLTANGDTPLDGVTSEFQNGRNKILKLMEHNDYPAVISVAQEVRMAMTEAYCLSRSSIAGERRFCWCRSPFGVRGIGWDKTIKNLKEYGFTDIFARMVEGGVAYYPSKVLPVSPQIESRGDQLKDCLAACRKYGIKCHIWKVCFKMDSASGEDFAQKMIAANRTQVDRCDVVRDRWLCPSNTENRALESDAILEIVDNYQIDGIHLDYIRYPGPECCFCEGCKKKFRDSVGRDISWPLDVSGALSEQWDRFRRQQITTLVETISSRVRQNNNSGVELSAAVFRHQPADAESVGQDWPVWCRKKYVDFICPMNYTESNTGFESWTSTQIENSAGIPCYPGIGLSVWSPGERIIRLIEQIEISRKIKTGGFAIFDYGHDESSSVLPLLSGGILKPQ